LKDAHNIIDPNQEDLINFVNIYFVAEMPRFEGEEHHNIYVIDYMRTTFIRALAVTIHAILAINHFARIDAYRARIVNVIPRIVIIFSRTVRPKLADTKIHRSFVTMTLFFCVIVDEFPVFEKTIRKR